MVLYSALYDKRDGECIGWVADNASYDRLREYAYDTRDNGFTIGELFNGQNLNDPVIIISHSGEVFGIVERPHAVCVATACDYLTTTMNYHPVIGA